MLEALILQKAKNAALKCLKRIMRVYKRSCWKKFVERRRNRKLIGKWWRNYRGCMTFSSGKEAIQEIGGNDIVRVNNIGEVFFSWQWNMCKSIMLFLLKNKAVSKISSCWVNKPSRCGIKQLRISFGAVVLTIFLLGKKSGVTFINIAVGNWGPQPWMKNLKE